MKPMIEIRGSLDKFAEFQAIAIARAADKAVLEATTIIKNAGRDHIGSRIPGKAKFLLRSKVYKSKRGRTTGWIYSKWQRRTGNRFDQSSFKQFKAAGRQYAANTDGYTDIMGAFETGATITPRRGKFLRLPQIGNRRTKAAGRRGAKDKNVDYIPLGRSAKNGMRYLVVEKKPKRGRSHSLIIAMLVERVTIPQRLNLTGIFAQKEVVLGNRLIHHINQQALSQSRAYRRQSRIAA